MRRKHLSFPQLAERSVELGTFREVPPVREEYRKIRTTTINDEEIDRGLEMRQESLPAHFSTASNPSIHLNGIIHENGHSVTVRYGLFSFRSD
jgi:hypothetical protein